MIGIGIIGYGYWGPNLARCAMEAGASRLIAIADQDPKAQARAASRHPHATVTGEWTDLLRNPAIDAIVIATPACLHYDMALAALAAGKHVLVEKPLAPSSRQAALLIQEAERRGLVLMVDHTFVYTRAVQKIRDLVVTGVVGDVYYFDSTRVNLGIFQRDVNVIWDLAVHDLAILDFVMPTNAVAISATGASHIAGTPENMAHITVYLEGGATAHLNVNWLAPVKIRRTLVGGSRRMIVYDDMEPSEKVKVYDRGVDLREAPATASSDEIRQILPDYRMGDVWTPRLGHDEALAIEIDHFCHCIDTAQIPLTSGESGLRVVNLLEGASRSMRLRGQPVEFGTMRMAS